MPPLFVVTSKLYSSSNGIKTTSFLLIFKSARTSSTCYLATPFSLQKTAKPQNPINIYAGTGKNVKAAVNLTLSVYVLGMALLGSNITSEVGLRLLLCPLGSNIVIRTACCSVGIALPVYSTFKAIERKDQDEQQKWLVYWAAFGSFSLVEVFSDKLLSWFPMYYHAKFAFLVWLQLPSADGAKHLYVNHLRPFFMRHQTRVDQVMGLAYGEIVKFVCAHQTEIQFAKTQIVRIMASANHMLRGDMNPVEPGGRRAIEGQPRTISDTESDHDD